VGGRLPTEAEWEKAASWDETKKVKRVYPWGDQFDESKCNTNLSGIRGTTPVDKYSSRGDSAYGIGDMVGNVWEWCADWYDGNYYKISPKRNPKGPDSGSYRVLRGGAWHWLPIINSRSTYRNLNDPDGKVVNPDAGSNILGFRYVVSTVLDF